MNLLARWRWAQCTGCPCRYRPAHPSGFCHYCRHPSSGAYRRATSGRSAE